MTCLRIISIYSSVLIFLIAFSAEAFPELIRHGYKSCTTCHSSVVGGDVLTPYGKSLAQELLSWRGLWPEQDLNDESDKSEDRMDWGGHLRVMQIHRDNSQRRSGRFFLMQFDGELNWVKNLWSVYTSVGRFEPVGRAESAWDSIDIPRLWGQYISSMENPTRFLFRLGKFLPGYGLNIAEHASVNRKALKLQPGSERLNLEVALESDSSLILLDLIGGHYSNKKFIDDSGLLFQFAWTEFDGFRLGFNIMNTKSNQSTALSEEKAMGLFGILGWSKQWSQLLQIDTIERVQSTKTLSVYSKISYEAQKGLNYFTTQEYLNDDLRVINPHFESLGVGVQVFPVSNVDLLFSIRQEKNTAVSKESDTVLWMLGHIYL